MLEEHKETFIRGWDLVQGEAVEIAKSKGWYDDPVSVDRCLNLIHGEVAEITEALRMGNPDDAKCPGHSEAEVEVADVIIRIMDLANRMNWDITSAIFSKMEYNKTRPYKHGKIF